MAFIPALNTARLGIEWHSNGGLYAVNTIYCQKIAGAITAQSLIDLADVIAASFFTLAAKPVSNNLHLARITARDMTSQNDDVVTQSYGTAYDGDLTSPLLPAQNTFAVSLRTGLAGKSFRGRLYHPGMTEDSAIGSFVDSARAAAIVNMWSTINSALVLDNLFRWVVASFYADKAPRATALLTPVTTVTFTDLRMDTLRTRLDNPGAI